MSVKLLFDQNLSPKLIRQLSDLYPNSDHLDLLGLGTADDTLVWEHAKGNDFVVGTKDADFADLGVLGDFPPKVVWIRREIVQPPLLKKSCATTMRKLRIC